MYTIFKSFKSKCVAVVNTMTINLSNLGSATKQFHEKILGDGQHLSVSTLVLPNC